MNWSHLNVEFTQTLLFPIKLLKRSQLQGKTKTNCFQMQLCLNNLYGNCYYKSHMSYLYLVTHQFTHNWYLPTIKIANVEFHIFEPHLLAIQYTPFCTRHNSWNSFLWYFSEIYSKTATLQLVTQLHNDCDSWVAWK